MDGRTRLAKAFGDWIELNGWTQTEVVAMGGPSTTTQTKVTKTDEPISRQTLKQIDLVMRHPSSAQLSSGGGILLALAARQLRWAAEQIRDRLQRRPRLRQVAVNVGLRRGIRGVPHNRDDHLGRHPRSLQQRRRRVPRLMHQIRPATGMLDPSHGLQPTPRQPVERRRLRRAVRAWPDQPVRRLRAPRRAR